MSVKVNIFTGVASSMDKHVRVAWLLDFYGKLLTPRQQDMLARYYEEDFSMGEIAQEEGISRQAVFDSLQRGEAALENYEAEIGLLNRHLALGQALQDCREMLQQDPLDKNEMKSKLDLAIGIWEREENHGV